MFRLAKEGSWVLAGQITSVLAALVLVRVLTEHLDPTQYGQLSLGLTVAGLVNQVVMGGLLQGIGRFYSIAAEKQDLHGYLRASNQLMFFATSAVVAMAVLLAGGLLWLGYSEWIGLAAGASVFSLVVSYNGALNGIQNAARQRAVATALGAIDAGLKILAVLLVMSLLGRSSTSVVIGYSLSSLVVMVLQLYFLRRIIPTGARIGDKASWLRQIWAFSWPFSTWGIFTWGQQSSERWALEAFGSTHDVGLYAVLMQLGYTPISMIAGLMMTFLSPILYQRSGDATDESRNQNVRKLLWQITSSVLLLTLAGCLAAIALHDLVFKYLVAKEYHTASSLLPWAVFAGGLFAAGQMLSLKLNCEMRPASLVRAKIVTALLGVAFNVSFAAIAGLNGILAASVAFGGVYLLWMIVLSTRGPGTRS